MKIRLAEARTYLPYALCASLCLCAYAVLPSSDPPVVMRGSPELFRLSATFAPLPEYPGPLLQAKREGLVVIEATVSAAGHVTSSRILESFDERASAAATAALAEWRFHSEKEMLTSGVVRTCHNCLRKNRLALDFRIEGGKGTVVDLAQREVVQLGLADPFRRKRE